MTAFVCCSGRLSWVGARALGVPDGPDGSDGPRGLGAGAASEAASALTGLAGPAARWKWSGCSHNVLFGGDFAKAFLDGRRPATDIQARVNQHNNRAGRLVRIGGVGLPRVRV